MDAWKEVESQIATAKAECLKYTQENPILKAKNVELRKEVIENNRKIAVAHGEYEDTIQLDKDLSVEIKKRKADVDTYVQDKIDSVNEKVEKTTAECATRIAVLDEREKSLTERESNVDKQEKANVAKAELLEVTAKELQSQADEIKDATKVLNTKAIDNQHELDMLTQRGVELDTQEARIAKEDADIGERIKRLQASEKKAQENVAQSQQLLYANDLNRTDIEKREKFLKTKEDDIKAREINLKNRTDLFVNSLRAGKML